MESSGFCIYSMMSSAIDSFTSPFPIWMPFISSSCLIAVARTSSTMLNKVVKAEILVLFLIVKKHFYFFCPLSMMLAVRFLMCGFYYVEVWSLYSHFVESFYYKWVLDFIKCLFCSYWYDLVIFIFHFVNVMHYIYWFVSIVSTLHPWNKSHLITVYDLVNVFLKLVC